MILMILKKRLLKRMSKLSFTVRPTTLRGVSGLKGEDLHMKKFLSRSSLVLSAALLVATSNSSLYSVFAEDTSSSTEESVESTVETESQTDEAMDHSMMEHDDEGRLPANIKLDRESTYKAGDKVLVNADHMPGMSGAEGYSLCIDGDIF